MAGDLDFQLDGELLEITIARGEENLFTPQMVRELRAAIERAASHGTRVIRLQGRGSSFCLGRERHATTEDAIAREAREIVLLTRAMRDTPTLVIAQVEGGAAGFGAGLVAAADVAIAADTASFWFPEARAGLAPAIVIGWLGRLLPHKKVFMLASTGARLSAAEAASAGLVTEAVPPGSVAVRVGEVIAQMLTMDGSVLAEIKRLIELSRPTIPDGFDEEAVASLVRGTVGAQASSASRTRPGPGPQVG